VPLAGGHGTLHILAANDGLRCREEGAEQSLALLPSDSNRFAFTASDDTSLYRIEFIRDTAGVVTGCRYACDRFDLVCTRVHR